MATISTIHRESDETLTFQLYKSDGSVEDVDDILDINATLIHKYSRITIATYAMAGMTLNSGDDTIDIFMPGTVTEDEQTGIYVIKVEWSVTNLNFPDGTEDSIDEQDIFELQA